MREAPCEGPNASISLEIQRRLAEADNYNRWIYHLLAPYLGQRILEAGCSIGNFTRLFLARELVMAVDVSPDAISVLQQRLGGRPNLQTHVTNLEGDEILQLAALNFDTIVCLNVLEHIQDDCRTLRSFYSLLTPGGTLLLYVPAFRGLYGSMDAADQHFRRYGRDELETKLLGAGFEVVRCHFVNFLGFFGWFINGRVLKRRVIPRQQLRFFNRAMVPLLERLEKRWHPPVGQSLFAVGRKVGDH